MSFGAAALAGPVEAAVPGWGQIAGSAVASEDLYQNAQVELSHLADVVGLVELVHQGVNVGQQGHGRNVLLLVFERIDDLPARRGWAVHGPGEGRGLTLVHPDVLLEAEALAIGEKQRLGEQERRAGQYRGVLRDGHLLLDEFHDLGVFDKALAHRLEDVVHHDGGGLALGDGFARGVHLVPGQVIGVFAVVERDVGGGLVVPLFQVGVLVLESVGQLVGQHRLLLLDVHPVEQVHGLGFRVVIGFDLLFEQREQKGFQLEVAVQQAEFLQDDFAALEAFCALILLEFLLQIAFHGCAGGDLTLDCAFDGQAGLLRGELEQFIDQREELSGLFGGDAGLSLFGGLGRIGLRDRR